MRWFATAVIAFCIGGVVLAQQNVGIGTNTPHPSALLHLESTTKGLLIPRMTQAQRDAISSPATGLVIYQTDNNPGFYYYTGTTWVPLLSNVSGSGLFWALGGNMITNPATQWLGTQNAQPLIIRTDGVERVWITATGQVGIGAAPSLSARLETQTLAPSGAVEAVFGKGSSGVSIMSGWPTIGFNAYYDYATTQWRSLVAGWTGNISVDQTSGVMRFELSLSAATAANQPVVHQLRMAITPTGRVGIGTLAPAQALHVEGSAYVANQLGVGVTSPTHTLQVSGTSALFSSASDFRLYVSRNTTAHTGTLIFQTAFSGRAELGLISGTEDFSIRVSPDGTNWTQAVTIDRTSGNVGLGTTTPTHRLHISATTDPLRIQGLQSDPTLNELLVVTSTGVVRTRSASSLVSGNAWSLTGNSGTNPTTNFLGTTDNQPLVIRTYNVERMRVTAGGQVGIGVTAPSERLEVAGNIGLRAGAAAFVGTVDNNRLELRVDNQASLILNPPGNAAPAWSIQRDAGGDQRGRYAVDLQALRTLASQVASGDYSVIGGGTYNTASGAYSTVGGGLGNVASGSLSTVGGGQSNTASNYGTVGGGRGNTASGSYSAVSGGEMNTASGQYSTVGGGFWNTAAGDYSAIAG
ncbi:MAG: hypothetical protein ABDH31_03740, partial [Chlorobiota bacterium]